MPANIIHTIKRNPTLRNLNNMADIKPTLVLNREKLPKILKTDKDKPLYTT
jgi:hypothetical protein